MAVMTSAALSWTRALESHRTAGSSVLAIRELSPLERNRPFILFCFLRPSLLGVIEVEMEGVSVGEMGSGNKSQAKPRALEFRRKKAARKQARELLTAPPPPPRLLLGVCCQSNSRVRL